MIDRAALFASLVAVALLLVAVPAAGQADDAPPPSPDDRILYAHHQEDADDEYAGWMNTRADDPDSDDVAMGASQACTLPEPIPGVDSDVEATWTLTLDPALNESVFLQQNASVFLEAYVGAPGGDGENLTVNTTLRADSVVVAHGENRTHNFTASDDEPYDAIEWEVPAQVSELHSGAALVWEIHAVGEACSVDSGPFLGVSDERGKSAIMLPLVEADASVAGQTLTGATARVALSFDEPTDARYVYDWSADAGTFELGAASDLASGTAFVEVTAPGGESRSFVLEGRMAEPAEPVTASAGTWQIEVNVEGAEGEVGVGIRPTGAATPPTASPSPSPNDAGNETAGPPDDGAPDGNGSAQQAPEDEGGSAPGVPLVLALLGVVAVVYATRRPR